MIFQTSVELDIDGKNVHVIFDMDTGMIGFTEISDSGRKEYSYQSGLPEFKIAFAKLMESVASTSHQSNVLICRKGKAAQLLQGYWSDVAPKS
ncbi:hypothetical protein [Halopseudomonas sabulinigri]|uniref:hypothetical protein n=1 Tax=Halopseudomonas sabulinigri TaxID=472181 RepID=UPI0012FD6BD2|nr:hypothetical protein [Halopseudomonas sabulinigri]